MSMVNETPSTTSVANYNCEMNWKQRRDETYSFLLPALGSRGGRTSGVCGGRTSGVCGVCNTLKTLRREDGDIPGVRATYCPGVITLGPPCSRSSCTTKKLVLLLL